MKDHVLPEIIREVDRKGHHYVPLDLLKPVFECDNKEEVCVKERLLIWAVENRIMYEYKEVGRYTVVKFLRRWSDTSE